MSDYVDPKHLIKEDVDAPGAEPGHTGKFLLLEVPNFNKGPEQDPALQMGSYIRLGAAAAGAGVTTLARRTGEDLAGMVQGFVDDTRDRDGAGAPALDGRNLPPGESPDPASPARTPGGSVQARRAESGVLHTKGGWRDHSDGNRITTTRGDKVEVIRGNYKMVVLGRQDGIGDAAGWDVSGGIVDEGDLDFASTPDSIANANDPKSSRSQGQEARKNARPRQQNLSVEFKWDQDSDGRWGWTQTTITGNEYVDPGKHTANAMGVGGTNPVGGTVGGKNPGKANQLAPGRAAVSEGDPGNGKIISKTWVDMIETHTGSDAKRVDRMSDETWANSITSTTNVGQMTQSIYCVGDFNQLTDANRITQTSSSFETTTASTARMSIKNTNNAQLITYEDWATIRSELDVAIALIAELKLSPIIAELKTGLHLDVHAAGHLDITGVELCEIVIGHHSTEQLICTEVSLEAEEITALKQALAGGCITIHTPAGSQALAPLHSLV